MQLVMFDIDGTLTETIRVDDECYVRALADVFGFTEIDTDWSLYPHATDSGILQELCRRRRQRPPAEPEIVQFRERFVELLTAASSESPLRAVAGAGPFLSRLAASGGHRISLATGGWRDSARLKMARAGLSFDDYPSASADDAVERESIMKISLQRAVQRHGGPFARTVYFGDGVWDARACRALGIPFIGIGSGDRAAKLTAAGAVRVFRIFPRAIRLGRV